MEQRISYAAQLPDGSFVSRSLGRTESLVSALRLSHDMDLGLIVKNHYKDFTVVAVQITYELVDEHEREEDSVISKD